MKVVKKIADNFEGYCCAVMLAVMSVVVFLQVIFRFVIKASLPWSEELSRYLLVYITYFGCAYGIKTGAHLGVEAFVLILPKTVQKAINVLVQIGGLVVCVLILKFGADIVFSQMQSGQLSRPCGCRCGRFTVPFPSAWHLRHSVCSGNCQGGSGTDPARREGGVSKWQRICLLPLR